MDGSFWHSLDTLAATLDGSRYVAETTLDDIQRQLMQCSRDERDEIRRKMIVVVAQFSRLETRLVEIDGPAECIV